MAALLRDISGYTESELKRVLTLFIRRIRFINVRLIPKSTYAKALSFTEDVDVDDTEFVALTEHIKGKFWSGDKALRKGLDKKGWRKFISTEEILDILKTQK
jgi:predicted nucleic acid-binding protein